VGAALPATTTNLFFCSFLYAFYSHALTWFSLDGAAMPRDSNCNTPTAKVGLPRYEIDGGEKVWRHLGVSPFSQSPLSQEAAHPPMSHHRKTDKKKRNEPAEVEDNKLL
jgi:hypothetical protein